MKETYGPHDHYAYLLEIRDTADDALFRFDELRAAARDWLVVHHGPQLPPSEWRAATDHLAEVHAAIFRALEGFLSAFARISYMIDPSSSKKYSRARGTCIQYLLDIAPADPIRNTELRDAWVHFDERMDAAPIEIALFERQGWGHSRNTTDAVRERALRYVEVDTLRVFFRDRAHRPRTAELPPLRDSIQGIHDQLQGQTWMGVTQRLNATSGNPCRGMPSRD